MTFRKKVGKQTITTGVRYNGKLIAQVTNEGDVISNTGKKIRYNSDGDIVEVAHSRTATNFRKNVKENLETGEVDIRKFDIGPKREYVVEHTNIDKHGAITFKTTPVKVKGKSSPIEK